MHGVITTDKGAVLLVIPAWLLAHENYLLLIYFRCCALVTILFY